MSAISHLFGREQGMRFAKNTIALTMEDQLRIFPFPPMFKISLILLSLAFSLTACKKSGSSAKPSASAAPSAPAPGLATAVTDEPASPAQATLGRPSIQVAPRSARRDYLWNLAQGALAGDMSFVCTRGQYGGEKQAASVTHYYIAPGTKVGDERCKNGLAYYGQPAMAGTCLHPCRALAADPRYHRPGEVIFFKNLVGMTCGTGRDKMIHDGFMVVTDNGNPDAINIEGRFGLFWGRCTAEQNGFCMDEGAIALDFTLTFSPYCRAWRPNDPLYHDNIKLAVYNAVRSEAARRGDHLAASKFDLDSFVGLTVDPSGRILRRFNHPEPWNPFANGGN